MLVLKLLYDPDRFFELKSDQKDLIGPTIIVSLTAVASILSTVVILNRFATTLPDTQGTIATISFSIGILMGFLAVYLGWVLTSALVYVLITRVFKHEVVDFRALFRLLGWGFLPSILGGISSAWAAYTVYYSINMPSDPQKLNALVASLSHSQIFTVSKYIVIVLTVWQGMLWIFAIRHTTDMDVRKSTIVASLPTGMVMLVQTFLG